MSRRRRPTFTISQVIVTAEVTSRLYTAPGSKSQLISWRRISASSSERPHRKAESISPPCPIRPVNRYSSFIRTQFLSYHLQHRLPGLVMTTPPRYHNMPPTIDIDMEDAPPAAAILLPPRLIVSKTSKPRTPLPDGPNQTPKKLSDRQQDTAKTLSDRPARPQSAPESPPERLLQTMDELDLYRQWSRLKKSMVARAKANPDKVCISFPCYWHEGEVEKARMLRGWQGGY